MQTRGLGKPQFGWAPGGTARIPRFLNAKHQHQRDSAKPQDSANGVEAKLDPHDHPVLQRLAGAVTSAAVEHGPHMVRGAEMFCGCGFCGRCFGAIVLGVGRLIVAPLKNAREYVGEVFQQHQDKNPES